jgi:hypothetical protein
MRHTVTDFGAEKLLLMQFYIMYTYLISLTSEYAIISSINLGISFSNIDFLV